VYVLNSENCAYSLMHCDTFTTRYSLYLFNDAATTEQQRGNEHKRKQWQEAKRTAHIIWRYTNNKMMVSILTEYYWC